jgi:hypothetical protein
MFGEIFADLLLKADIPFWEPSRMVNWRQDPCDRTIDK